jgi:hypothetical protein
LTALHFAAVTNVAEWFARLLAILHHSAETGEAWNYDDE